MSYRNTQTGLVGPVLFVPMAVVFLVMVIRAGAGWGPLVGLGAFFLIAGAMLANFSRMTTSIDDSHLHLAFGRGWPRRQIELAEVINVGLARSLWWHGFGMRLTPVGWLYSVWGLDVVELRLKSGDVVRVGSDETEALAAAVRASLTPGSV